MSTRIATLLVHHRSQCSCSGRCTKVRKSIQVCTRCIMHSARHVCHAAQCTLRCGRRQFRIIATTTTRTPIQQVFPSTLLPKDEWPFGRTSSIRPTLTLTTKKFCILLYNIKQSQSTCVLIFHRLGFWHTRVEKLARDIDSVRVKNSKVSQG